MNDVAPTSARDRAPFAGVPAREVVRDVVAVMALLVALPMPWDLAHRGTDRLEVVLVTVLAVLAIAAPYALRGGLLPSSWERVTTPSARVLGCAPYAVVAVLYLVLDLVRSADDAGRVGAGVALGLAGAVLGAAPRWPHGLAAASGVVAVLALVTPVLSAVHGDPWATVVGAVLNLALVLGVLWLTALALLRGDVVGGIVLVGVGAAVALELALLGGGAEQPWFESVHGARFGLLLLPVVAAFAVPRVVDALRAVAGEPSGAHAAQWVAVAVRTFDLVLLVAGFVALVAIVRTAAGGVAVNLVLRMIFGVLMALVAVMARRALVRDPRGGHVTAVGAACVLVVLGLVIVIARAGVGTRSNLEELLVTFALPAMVLLALLAPPSVRELVAADAGARPVSGEEHAAPADPAGARDAGWYAAPVEPAGSWWANETQGLVSGEQPAPHQSAQPASPSGEQPASPSGEQPGEHPDAARYQPGVADAAPASAWQGSWVPADQTQALPPVGQAYDAQAGYEAQPGYQAQPSDEPEPGHGPSVSQDARPYSAVERDVEATQALPPVVDVPGSRWTVAQALDPSTPLADLALIVQEAPHLRPHVAANPSTYPALLDWLGALGDPAVDAALRSRR